MRNFHKAKDIRMRRVWFRRIISLVWLLAAAVSLCHGGIALAVFDLVMGGYFGYHSFLYTKEEKRDGRR